MSGRMLPTSARGNMPSIARALKGTDKEIWIKYLTVMHKNSAKTEEEWHEIINKAGKVRAKAYA